MVTGSGNTAIHQLFSYDSSGNVVSVDYSSNGGSTFTTYYYLRNAQNDVVKLIDGSGNTVVQYTYDSWGKPISVTGTLASTLGANQPFRYRGYVYDTETGWYYLQSRYYDPSVGRFISADVLLSTGQGVIGHNSYAYCGNNPVIRADAEGTCFFTVLGAVVGGVIGGISAAINGDDVVAGIVGGAVSGAIAGAATDITVATGGVAAPLIVVAAGAVSGLAGDAATQVVTSMRQGESFSNSINNLDVCSLAISTACGALGGVASLGIGKMVSKLIFDPIKKSFVDSFVRHAFDSTVKTMASETIITAATRSGLIELGADGIIKVGQILAYQFLNNAINPK